MEPFELASAWHVEGPMAKVWGALLDPVDVASHWKGAQAQAHAKGRLKVGSRYDWTVQAPWGMELHFQAHVTKVDEHREIHFRSEGDLEGEGVVRNEAQTGGSSVPVTDFEFRWNVVPRRRLWVILSHLPGGRRFLSWGHERLMHDANAALVAAMKKARPV